jgi:hypothetical protein
MDEYKTYIVTFAFQGRFWVRLSAQVYLDVEDYEFAAKVLKELIARVKAKEYVTKE